MVADRGAQAVGNLITLISRGTVQQDEHLVVGRMGDDIIAAQVPPNQLHDLLPERRGLAAVRAGPGSVCVDFYGEQ
jgi:hypothetical protein